MDFLLRFYSFIILILSLVLLVFGFGFFEDGVYAAVDYFYQSTKVRIAYIVFLLLLAGLSLFFLLQRRGRKSTTDTINQKNELGETRVSVTALENIAAKVLQRIAGVKDWQIRLRSSEVEGHQFFIKVVVDGEVPIPQLIEQVQNEVKQRVEEISGVPIRNVSVLVSDIVSTGNQKSRRVE